MTNLLWPRSPGMDGEHSYRTARRAGSNAVRSAGENHRHLGSQSQTRAVSLGKETELLCQNVAGFEIRCQQDVRIACNLRANTFCSSCLLADGIVKCLRP